MIFIALFLAQKFSFLLLIIGIFLVAINFGIFYSILYLSFDGIRRLVDRKR
jgi:hypothetical protein